jgi:hypothetical protein
MTDPTPDALVAEARRAVHESLALLPAWEADRVRSLIADLESAVESRTAIQCADATAPVDQAAALREAADELGRMDYETDSNDYGYDTYRDAWNGGVMDGAEKLRRLAAETQPAEAHPPQHRWRVEMLDPLANEWAPGTPWPVREQAMERYELMIEKAPMWKDGAPVHRRIVRETTTYTVEAEHTPAAGARQDDPRPSSPSA